MSTETPYCCKPVHELYASEAYVFLKTPEHMTYLSNSRALCHTLTHRIDDSFCLHIAIYNFTQ